MSVRVTVVAITAAAMVLGACGASGGGGSDRLGWGEDYSVTGALAELPAELGDADIHIQTGDLTAATEAAGIERPTNLDDIDLVYRWVTPITGGPDPVDRDARPIVFVPFADVFQTQQLINVDDFHDELGWSVLDVDSFVEYHLPPVRFSVVAGSSFDDDTLDDLIELGAGVVTNRDGADLTVDAAQRSGADLLGRPLRLAQQDDRIAVALASERAQEWVTGLDETLADDEDLMAIAEALDRADVFAAYLVRPAAGFSSTAVFDEMVQGRGTPEIRERLEERLDAVASEPFHAVGIGWNTDDDGSVVTVVYQHLTEATAAANVDAIDDMFTNGVSFIDNQPLSNRYVLIDVQAEGTVVTATLRPGEQGWPHHMLHALQARDLPLIHR